MQKNKTNKRKNGSWRKLREQKVLIPLIIGVIAVVVIIVAVVIIVLNASRGDTAHDENSDNDTEYSIAPDPETGEPPLFGGDPNKDNSGEAFVEFEQRIIASPDYSIVEKNNARILIAVYYNAVELYDKAKEILQTVESDTVFGEQLVQLYEAYANMYSGMGEIERENEYRSLIERIKQ